jgi:hypothetical protein
MKSLFSDPLHWAKAAVGSRLRFGLTFSLHLILCGLMGVILYEENMQFMIFTLVLVGIAYPFMYLYALRKLVLLIGDQS